MRRILVCLDRSTRSEACLPHAVSLARVFGSTVTLLYVMQPLLEHSGAHITDPLGWEVARREAATYLEGLARTAREEQGLSVSCRVEQGRPAERIIMIAQEIGADLTVIGSHGESGLPAWNLGSTAQQILAVSRGSVLLAHAAAYAPAMVTPTRILVPLDGSARTESVLPTAVRIAETHDAEVVLVHIVAEPVQTAVLQGGDLDLARELATRLESRAKRYLDHLRERLPRELRVRTRTSRSVDGRQSLLETARQENAELIVLSAHGSVCNPSRPFGSVTDYLLAHSTIPLLVLQDLRETELERIGEDEEARSAPAMRASFPLGRE